MSNNISDDRETRSNFASRLLNRALSERKKTGEITLTTAEAAQYAVPDKETKEVVTAASER